MLQQKPFPFATSRYLHEAGKIPTIIRYQPFYHAFLCPKLTTWLTLATFVFVTGNPALAADFEPIAYSGQLAVGAPPGATHGGNFTNGSNPALGDDSSVYYTSGINGVGAGNGIAEGLWRANKNGTTAFWIQGDTAPGTPVGTTFRNTFGIVPNGIGETAFIGRVDKPDGSFGTGIWAGPPGSFGLVALQGNTAPGTTSTFTGTFSRIVYNNSGQVAFQDRFEGNSRLGIWSGTPGLIQAVALEGDQAPGFGPGVTFGNLSLPNQPLALNNSGTLAFFSQLFGAPGNPHTIWTGSPGAISAAVAEGQVAPATGGKLFSSFGAAIDINDNGQIGFRATLSDNLDSAWFGDPDNLTLIAQRGDQAPGLADDVIFKRFEAPLINDQGKFALLANVGEESISQSLTSLWIGSDTSLELIAKGGDQALGLADGTNFSIFRNVIFNNRGQVAFDGVFSGAESGTAIFATDGTDEYSLVAKAGDIVEIDGEMETISALSLFRIASSGSLGRLSGSSDGRASSFNDEGDLMFIASFEGGGSGIFLTNVSAIPLPPTLILFVSGLFGLLGLRRVI